MIRNEIFQAGVCTHAEVIDLDACTITIEEYGLVTSIRALTLTERAAYGPPPLNNLGVAMTVLVIEGILTLPVAAAAAQVTEEALINEALAWAVAAAARPTQEHS